jgi:iron(III) transport system permease protein
LTKPAGDRLIRIRRHSLFLFLVAGTVAVPLGVVASSVLSPSSEIWTHVVENLLSSYIGQTIGLASGTLAASILIGVSAAWLTVRYDFPGRRLLSVALVIPMALPAYIGAFAWSGIFDYTGPWQGFLRNVLPEDIGIPVPDIMSLPGAVFVMTMVLYPYIFLPVRSAFRQQTGTLHESARMLGAGEARLFFRIALPMARPALVGGGILVLMEVLNEYGAVHYFGVNTLTTGIFRSWFALGDLTAAMKLATILLLLVTLLILAEKKLRGRRAYSQPTRRPVKPLRLRGTRAAAAAAVCSLPVLFGFVFPVLQLTGWAASAGFSAVDSRFFRMLVNTFSVTGGATALILLTAVLSAHFLRSPVLRWKRSLSAAMTLGYAVPGTVIAIGVMSAAGFVDRGLNEITSVLFGASGRLFLSGSIAVLMAAYAVRYLGVAFNPVDAGFTQVSGRIHEAARILGRRPLNALWSVDLPNLPASLKAAAIMVAIDVLKELPLTLVLRPFNFETLATRAFEMASDERLSMAALPSLIIVILGVIPVYILTSRKETK